MPSYTCATCGASFDVPQKALDKYPGWQPRQCRSCKPSKGGSRRGGGRSRGRGGAPEENLSPREVLAKYGANPTGPTTGVFTDGSSKPNPGPGGWGVVWVRDGEIEHELHGHEGHTTNNRMELTALIEAFRLLPEDAEETVYTDSRLCVDTITKWAPGWERKGWKKKGGEIKNLELVQALLAEARAHPGCKLEWIAAHSGHLWNEYADSLATTWMR